MVLAAVESGKGIVVMKKIVKFFCELACSLGRARAAAEATRLGNHDLARSIISVDCRC